MLGVNELVDQDRVFSALAHQTRRAVLLVLHVNGGEMTSGSIAGRFGCTWQTTSRHLRVLEEAGLIRATLRGRERVYQLNTGPIYDHVQDFVDRFGETSETPSGQDS
ncbi:ArsR/SmtB family transcription factor [Gordonia polyisoprenivorans]|uniref:ArsR/SmtB family transcription factor n=1 Tax=Gordonia polyisoprenivorans TaxID=84595 RepID=UPI0009D9BD75